MKPLKYHVVSFRIVEISGHMHSYLQHVHSRTMLSLLLVSSYYLLGVQA